MVADVNQSQKQVSELLGVAFATARAGSDLRQGRRFGKRKPAADRRRDRRSSADRRSARRPRITSPTRCSTTCAEGCMPSATRSPVAISAPSSRTRTSGPSNVTRSCSNHSASESRERTSWRSSPSRAIADLERLGYEYLPLTFSRRHGDPSRPWNRFDIQVKDEDGRELLGYQGNWRDIFQNWEALSHQLSGVRREHHRQVRQRLDGRRLQPVPHHEGRHRLGGARARESVGLDRLLGRSPGRSTC